MFNFFADASIKRDNCYYISGSDFNHIKNVLRMKVGDEILVSCDGESDLCVLREFFEDTAVAEITAENYQSTELDIKIYLFEGLPKGDKMELIIQKCVELGVYAVVPTEMSRCVVKLDDKKKKSKISRWQSISESAAKQSKRNTVPEIMNVMSYKEALLFAEKLDLFLVPYESKNGMADTVSALKEITNGMSVGILVGPEGGFDEKEIDEALSHKAKIISLGKRILRTETAAITAVGMCMLYSEMNSGEKE